MRMARCESFSESFSIGIVSDSATASKARRPRAPSDGNPRPNPGLA